MRAALLLVAALVVAGCGRSPDELDRACASSSLCATSGSCWYTAAPEKKFGNPLGDTGLLAGQCEPRSNRDCEGSSWCSNPYTRSCCIHVDPKQTFCDSCDAH